MYTYYNLTNITNAGNQTTILTFVQGVNGALGGFPTLMIMVSIYITTMIILIGKGADVFKAFAATSFVMMLMAFIVYGMSLISGKSLVIFCILFPFSMFLLWVWGGSSY